jgi:hypothetical protein
MDIRTLRKIIKEEINAKKNTLHHNTIKALLDKVDKPNNKNKPSKQSLLKLREELKYLRYDKPEREQAKFIDKK